MNKQHRPYPDKHKLCKTNVNTMTSSHTWDRIKHNTLFLGLASIVWLIFRSGRKPSRIQYPCQKAAAAYVSMFFIPMFALMAQRSYHYLKSCGRAQAIRFLVTAALIAGVLLSAAQLWTRHQQAAQTKYYDQLRSRGPFGLKTAGAAGITAGLISIPHAMALPSPHRVVSVHDVQATSWDFQCTGTRPCGVYYGDDAFVDQDVVNQMFDRGMKALTNTNSIQAAWSVILPDYRAGEIVAVKVNFNDSIMGGGTSGYGDNDAYVDALPQIVNAVVAGLKTRGVAEENIRVFDASRYITDRFRALIDYPNIQYYDRYGNGDDVQASTFDSGLASADIDFDNSGYPATSSTHKITDVLVDSDYMINIPIMKKHGGAGITLALKNHLGTINGFTSGGHAMHNYFYLDGNRYEANTNPIVDINDNPHIRDKTVLIIGDALYGGWRSNNTPPERWDTFDNTSPNMLFFAIDPVAIDSVMFDYLDREGFVNPASEDILIVAANAGLGIHERWNNDNDRDYTTIDYVEIDQDASQPPTTPQDLAASAHSPIQIDLNWSASTDADDAVEGYRIYRDGNRIASTTTTSYSDMDLSPGTAFTYTVSAFDMAGNEGAASDPATATTEADNDPPTVPAELVAIPISSIQVDLSWTASEDNVHLAGYHVYRGGVLIASTGDTDYADRNLTAGTAYTYTTSAYDSAGNESAVSQPATATTAAVDNAPPTVPADLVAVPISPTQVDLSWTACEDNVHLAGYHIYRGGVLIASTGDTDYTDRNLTVGTTYTYTTSAYDSAGNESAVSDPATATTAADSDPPTVPADLVAVPISPTQVDLSWTACEDNVHLAGYHIYRDGVLIASTGDTDYTDRNLTVGTTYTYTTSAYDSAGNESAVSQPATATTVPDNDPPTIPADLVAIPISPTQVDLSWTSCVDNVHLAGYHVYRDGALVESTDVTNFTDENLTAGATYTYTTSAYDSAGNESNTSASATALTPNESIPSNLDTGGSTGGGGCFLITLHEGIHR